MIKACIDTFIPQDKYHLVRELAIQENPANALGDNLIGGGLTLAPQLVLLTQYRWKTGRTLNIGFYDADFRVKEKVIKYAREWEKYANIKFNFIDDVNQADIRISFVTGGSWSYIGTIALVIDKDKPTMNYGWLTPDTPNDEYSRVVIHEFGHMLGLVHEHMHPEAGIPWDKEKTYDYYANLGWDKEQVDRNLFARYSRDKTQYSEHDPDSIMHYPVPKELTIDGSFEVGYNRVLSDMDKYYVQQLYPFTNQIEFVSLECVSGEDNDTQHFYVYSSWELAFSKDIKVGELVTLDDVEPVRFNELARVLLGFFDTPDNTSGKALQQLGVFYVHLKLKGEQLYLDLYGNNSQYKLILLVA